MDYPYFENYKSCENIKENIVELRNNILQLDYTDINVITKLTSDFDTIVFYVFSSISKNASHKSLDIIKQAEYIHLLENLFCFVSYVRDIHMGLGIRTLSYSFTTILYNYFPEFTQMYIMLLIQDDSKNTSIGSWRDAIGICDYLHKYKPEHPFINFLISTINNTLFHDLQCFNKTGNCKTNISKWIPRENSSKKWLFISLSIKWCETHHAYLFKHCKNITSRIRAEKKCYMIYRKMISKLSLSLHTTERMLSENNNFSPVLNTIPVHSLFKNWFLLFNTTRDMGIRHKNSKLHLLGSDLLSQQVKNLSLSTHSAEPYFVNYHHFPQAIDKIVAIMFQCIRLITDHQRTVDSSTYIFTLNHFEKMFENICLLNTLWEKIYHKWSLIAEVDTKSIAVINIQANSLCDPMLYRAVSRACFIAQASNINRILFSAHVPIWINLQHCDDLYSKINCVYTSLENEILINTSLENSLQLLGDNHPFTPIIINNNGFCYNYNYEPTFKDCLEIVDNSRYKKIQESFQNNVHLINMHFQCHL
jgi:hypothetical protein